MHQRGKADMSTNPRRRAEAIGRTRKMESLLLAATITFGPAVGSAVDLELYAVAHMSADSVDDGEERSEYVASNSSRLGLRGAHELSPGMKVVFQFEQGIDLTGQGENDGNGPETGSSLFTTARDSFLGLEGAFGTVRAGKLGGLNQWVYDFNLFADQVGDLGNLWGGTGLPGRLSDAVQYLSPTLAGLNLALTYVPDEGVDGADVMVAKADYQWQALKLGAAYIDLGKPSGAPGDDRTAWALTGSYVVGPLTLGAGWQRDEGLGAQGRDDRDSYVVGGSYGINDQWAVKTHYVGSDASEPDADAWLWAFGVDFAWTADLTAYLAYSTTSNDPNAAFSTNDYGKGDAVFPLPGNDPNAVSIGLVYRFKRTWP